MQNLSDNDTDLRYHVRMLSRSLQWMRPPLAKLSLSLLLG